MLISYMKRNWIDAIADTREANDKIRNPIVPSDIQYIPKRPTDFRVPFAATERLIIDASPTSIGRYRKLKENGPAWRRYGCNICEWYANNSLSLFFLSLSVNRR